MIIEWIAVAKDFILTAVIGLCTFGWYKYKKHKKDQEEKSDSIETRVDNLERRQTHIDKSFAELKILMTTHNEYSREALKEIKEDVKYLARLDRGE